VQTAHPGQTARIVDGGDDPAPNLGVANPFGCLFCEQTFVYEAVAEFHVRNAHPGRVAWRAGARIVVDKEPQLQLQPQRQREFKTAEQYQAPAPSACAAPQVAPRPSVASTTSTAATAVVQRKSRLRIDDDLMTRVRALLKS
jgi:hypothetical protein